MTEDTIEKSFYRKVRPAAAVCLGILLLAATYELKNWLREQAMERHADLDKLDRFKEQLSFALSNSISLRDLKRHDVDRFQAGLSGLVQSKRILYEAGLALQEEKRLLEKQWEIMTTYLMVDEETHRILVMKGEQVSKSYPLPQAFPHALGGFNKPLPNITRIISKERFAHPERGKSEIADGKLQWNPPQVGTSLRSNALGEYVMFTHAGLILHGPPQKVPEHEAFPHFCFELPLSTARELYRNSFIGIKILLATSKAEKTGLGR